MVSRASHYRAKAKHDQRSFGEVKPKLLARELETVWVPEWRDGLRLLALITIQTAAESFEVTEEEANKRLRKMSQMGLLRMTAHREAGVFVEYRWQLTEASRV